MYKNYFDDETKIFFKNRHQKRCTKLKVANVAFPIVSILMLACCIAQFAWAIVLQLFSYKILNVDPITEPSNVFGKKFFQRISSILLFVCGSLVLLYFVFGLLTSRRRYHHSKRKYSKQRLVFSIALKTNVILYCVLIVFCVAGQYALLSHQSTAMTTLQVNNASEAALRRMIYYQNFFGCCGTENVTDWLVPTFLGIPDSCCKHALTSCDNDVIGSGEAVNETFVVYSNFSLIYNDGCKEVIAAYTYSTGSLVVGNGFILVIFFISWHARYKQRRKKYGPPKTTLKIVRSVHVHDPTVHLVINQSSNEPVRTEVKIVSSVYMDDPAVQEQYRSTDSFAPALPASSRQSRLKIWPMEGRYSPEATRPHHRHDRCKSSVVEYSDWKSIHRGAEEERKKWPRRSVSSPQSMTTARSLTPANRRKNTSMYSDGK